MRRPHRTARPAGRRPAMLALVVVLAATGCDDAPEPAPATAIAWELNGVLPYFGSEPMRRDPAAPADPAATALGAQLAGDPEWSAAGDRSCRSCHDCGDGPPDAAPEVYSVQGFRRDPPTLVDAHRHAGWFWDWRAETLEDAVRLHLQDAQVTGHDSLQAAAAAAGDALGRELPADDLVDALVAWLRTLSSRTVWDVYLDGDEAALTAQQRRGLQHFVAIGCAQCHHHRTLGGTMTHRFGTYEILTEDPGAAGLQDDPHWFKVPGLRRVRHTGPWFHDGSAATLEQAVRTMARAQNDHALTDAEFADLLAFLQAASTAAR